MRVVVAYTELRPRVAAELEAQAPECEFVDVSGSPTAYWALLGQLWERQETFALIEHDVLIGPGTIERFASCPEPWCSSAPCLQSCRFRREIMCRHPTLVSDTGDWNRHWAAMPLEMPLGCGEHVHVHHDTPIEHLGARKTDEEGARRGDSLADYRWSVERSAYVAACRARGLSPRPEPGVEQRRCMMMFEHLRRMNGRLIGAPAALMDEFREYLMEYPDGYRAGDPGA